MVAISFVKRRKSKNRQKHQIYLCKKCGRHFTYNPNKVDLAYIINPEREYQKDIWDVRQLGISTAEGCYRYKINFTKIEQPWLKETAKQYIKLTLATLSYSSASEKTLAIGRLSQFLTKSYLNIEPHELDRNIIINYLADLAGTKLSASTRCTSIGALKGFFETSYQYEWL